MLNFYCVMHYSAKRGLVIACRLYIFVFNFCTHFYHAKPRPGRGQGQSLKAKAEAKASRPRPRPKFWPRGQLGLEDLTSLLTLPVMLTKTLTLTQKPNPNTLTLTLNPLKWGVGWGQKEVYYDNLGRGQGPTP